MAEGSTNMNDEKIFNSLNITDKEVFFITINNKEVQSIKRVSDDAIIYEKALPEPSLILTVTGSSFKEYNSSTALRGDNIIIDYGDGTIEPLNGRLSHTYNDGISSHEIKIYNVTTLGGNCFRRCVGMTSITISDSVTSIGIFCFYNCTGLTSITLPNSITSLETQCFYSCTRLASITIPDSVTSIGDKCFDGCTRLASITIPDNITSIGNYCFKSCTGLTSITIPDNITSIGNYCFTSCTGLTSITLNWTGTDILTYQSNWITSANSNLKFKIPAGTKQLYVDKGYPEDKLIEDPDGYSTGGAPN